MHNMMNPEASRQMTDQSSKLDQSSADSGNLFKEPLDKWIPWDDKEIPELPTRDTKPPHIPNDLPTYFVKEPLDSYIDKIDKFDEKPEIINLDNMDGHIHESGTDQVNLANNQDTSSEESVNSPEISSDNEGVENPSNELTDEDRVALKERTGWSDSIVDAIRTKDEAEVYEKAGLIEGEVNGKPALLQPRLDGDAHNSTKWPDWSNKDLASEGYAPYDENGRPYELHHIGQNPDSPLAELTYEQHHKDGNFSKLHTFDDSGIDRGDFNKERKAYWEDRYNSM